MTYGTSYYAASTFTKPGVLNYAPRSVDEEAAALRYLDKFAPDLVGVIMGGVL